MSGMERLTDEAFEAVQFLYKHGDLTYSVARAAVSKLIDNGFTIRRASQAAPAPSDALREAVDAAWNDAIEAAASVYLNGANPNTWDYFASAVAAIRALRRTAPTEGEA